jgi:hypothetical protein
MTVQRHYLVSTLGLVGLVAAYFVLQGAPPRPGPRLERPPQGLARPAAPPRLLTAHEILSRADLGLASGQVERLQALDLEWSERNRGLLASVEAAQAELSHFMETQGTGRANLAELERRSADFRELSAELRQRRTLHAEAAMDVLTEPQRRQLVPATSPETR